MRLADFEGMVRRLCDEVPPEFFDGISEVIVSPRVVPDPERPDVFTLGECIPLPLEVGSGVEGLQSQVVMYHGSFAALAGLEQGMNWRQEAWETLTHELRHHLEWRAHAPDLENFDWAVEQNFARHDGESFDSTFYLSGNPEGEDRYSIEDDLFIDRTVSSLPEWIDFSWQGREYRVELPRDAELPCFLAVKGVSDPPSGELVLVLRRKPGVRDLFGRGGAFQADVQVLR